MFEYSYHDWVLIIAACLLLQQFIYPHHWTTKITRGEPPERFIGPFSFGELIAYAIRCLTIPLTLQTWSLPAFINQFIQKQYLVNVVALVAIYWSTGYLARKLDGWE